MNWKFNKIENNNMMKSSCYIQKSNKWNSNKHFYCTIFFFQGASGLFQTHSFSILQRLYMLQYPHLVFQFIRKKNHLTCMCVHTTRRWRPSSKLNIVFHIHPMRLCEAVKIMNWHSSWDVVLSIVCSIFCFFLSKKSVKNFKTTC